VTNVHTYYILSSEYGFDSISFGFYSFKKVNNIFINIAYVYIFFPFFSPKSAFIRQHSCHAMPCHHQYAVAASILNWLIVAFVGLAKSAVEFSTLITAQFGAIRFAESFRRIGSWNCLTALEYFLTFDKIREFINY
jgi:hypothetical protein